MADANWEGLIKEYKELQDKQKKIVDSIIPMFITDVMKEIQKLMDWHWCDIGVDNFFDFKDTYLNYVGDYQSNKHIKVALDSDSKTIRVMILWDKDPQAWYHFVFDCSKEKDRLTFVGRRYLL